MARRDISMSAEETAAFLTEGAKALQVATISPDGWPHLAPLWYAMEGAKIVFRSFTKSQKIVNLRRDPRLTVLVEAGQAYADLRGVMINGEAELIENRDYILELYARMSERYPLFGPTVSEVSREQIAAAFGRYADKNTAVVVHPLKVVSWDHRKLGGDY